MASSAALVASSLLPSAANMITQPISGLISGAVNRYNMNQQADIFEKEGLPRGLAYLGQSAGQAAYKAPTNVYAGNGTWMQADPLANLNIGPHAPTAELMLNNSTSKRANEVGPLRTEQKAKVTRLGYNPEGSNGNPGGRIPPPFDPRVPLVTGSPDPDPFVFQTGGDSEIKRINDRHRAVNQFGTMPANANFTTVRGSDIGGTRIIKRFG